MSDERYCPKCKAWHAPTYEGWQAGCINQGPPAAETAGRTLSVELKAPGFHGRFLLPDADFNGLLAWLSKHSCEEINGT